MRRIILYGGAGAVLVSMFVTTWKITTTATKPPACPRCGSSDVLAEYLSRDATEYRCRRCGERYLGPERLDFSWADALEGLISEGP